MTRPLALAMLVGAVACGGDDDADATDDGSSSDSGGTSSDDGSASTGDTQTGDDSSSDATGTDNSTDDSTDDGADESSTGEPTEFSMELIGRYSTEVFDEGAAEISAFDPESERLFVVNGATESIDVIDLADPTMPTFIEAIAVADGGSPNSVDVHDGVVAVAVQNADPQQPGVVEFYDPDGERLA